MASEATEAKRAVADKQKDKKDEDGKDICLADKPRRAKTKKLFSVAKILGVKKSVARKHEDKEKEAEEKKSEVSKEDKKGDKENKK
ncbi:MAG: hypothetical protein U9R14_04690 [Patescibacteria group bacterium]|nr:hypothetical protein [Patescibacteria group bacterium]